MAARLIFHLLRIAVAVLFVYAGLRKIWDIDAWWETRRWAWATQQFALDVQNYQLTSWTVSIVAAVYLPWLEIVAGAALLWRKLTLGSIALLSGLMLVFMAALASAWWRGLDISCGCFGRTAENAGIDPRVQLVTDAIIFAALMALLWREARAPGGRHGA